MQHYLHTNKLSITTSELFKKSGVLPDSLYHLVDKADITPSPLGSSSNWCCLTGETNDFVSICVFALNRAGFSHLPYAPSKPLQPQIVELSGIEPLSETSVEIT